ncbi:hypothetical protein Patl1_31439 [Pistacia atlantica]|uniref:Uncharacterized protein n=1 Tax=Pistacia atlantica TaxID=434234 RepID=A0ACC1ALV4_9ROSI|nr:hypothetical protein Patl1_31439 [Pistacia atlantica]
MSLVAGMDARGTIQVMMNGPSCPSLNKAKGGLGGVTFITKIYAIGVGIVLIAFQMLKCFDLKLERWIGMLSPRQKRFSLAAAEIDGVLYATGGFDGKDYLSAMVSSVEIYDSRMDSWMTADPMKQARGYSAAAVLKESIYDVECYKEGQGWEVIDVIGKMSFMSAFTL